MATDATAATDGAAQLETYVCDDSVVRTFAGAAIAWGVVGMLVGLVAGLQLVRPDLTEGHAWLGFGRLRPVHTNLAVLGFAGNAIFAGLYYAAPRLLEAPMRSRRLSRLHLWGWQVVVAGALVTLPRGATQVGAYAELAWPLDLVALVASLALAANLLGTLPARRRRHVPVPVWFFIASVVVVPVAWGAGNLAVPTGVLSSRPAFTGAAGAIVQVWSAHAFIMYFLTMPLLGLLYYALPKAAHQPLYSERLAIVHFWAIVVIAPWAAPLTALDTTGPAWASTVGMLAGVLLLPPLAGAAINGFMTLRGVWHRVADKPALRFFVVALAFYTLWACEGAALATKSVSAVAAYTGWPVAHAHLGALGWVGFMIFGLAYRLAPRLLQAPLRRPRLVTAHFWLAAAGVLLMIIPQYVTGVGEALMGRAFDERGILLHPDFIETAVRQAPLRWVGLAGGALYATGAALAVVNLIGTWRARPVPYAVRKRSAAPLDPAWLAPPRPPSRLADAPVAGFAKRLDLFCRLDGHARVERAPSGFAWGALAAVAVALIGGVGPALLWAPRAIAPAPTALERLGRDVYIAEGCVHCHSQMVRAIFAETERYGPPSGPATIDADGPALWGTRRIGPDLLRAGGRATSAWHVRHLVAPRSVRPGSTMPSYAHLLRRSIDLESAGPAAGAQADDLARAVRASAGLGETVSLDGLDRSAMVALVAYLQQRGRTP